MLQTALGAFTLELQDVRLALPDPSPETVPISFVAQLQGDFQWANARTSTFTSPVIQVTKLSDGFHGTNIGVHDYVVLDLSSEAISRAANVIITIEVRRGAASSGTDAPIASYSISLCEVFKANNAQVAREVPLVNTDARTQTAGRQSVLRMQLFGDGELAAYVLGGAFIRLEKAEVLEIPSMWSEIAAQPAGVSSQAFQLDVCRATSDESTVGNVLPEERGLQGTLAPAEGRLVFGHSTYAFVHRRTMNEIRSRPTVECLVLQLSRTMKTMVDTGDKKKQKKDEPTWSETSASYTGSCQINLQTVTESDTSIEVVLSACDDARRDPQAATEELHLSLYFSVLQTSSTQVSGPINELTVSDVIPKYTRSRPRPPVRDVGKELRLEIKDIVSMVANEYVRLFPQDGVVSDREERKAKLLHHLSTSGIYHNFKEKLKPRIRRVVRERYGSKQQALEGTSTGAAGEMGLAYDEFISDLYVHLLNESTMVLNAIYQETTVEIEEIEVYDSITIADMNESAAQKVERLLRLAIDAEATENNDRACKCLMDRVEVALSGKNEGQKLQVVSECWLTLAKWHMRSNAVDGLEKAQSCLIEAVSANDKNVWAVFFLGAVYLETGLPEKANACLQAAIRVSAGISQDSNGSSVTDSDTSTAHPSTHVLTFLFLMQRQQAAPAYRALESAVQAHLAQGLTPTALEQGRPRRTAVCVLLQTAFMLIKHGCKTLARLAYVHALDAEQAAQRKARAKGLLVDAPMYHSQLTRRVNACLLASSGDHAGMAHAEDQWREALIFHSNNLENRDTWVELGDLCYRLGNVGSAVESYASALSLQSQCPDSSEPLPVRVYYRTGTMLLDQLNPFEAQSIFLSGCAKHASAALWLGVGVSLIRQENWKDAEEALKQASRLDYENAHVWGFYALLCLCSSSSRLNDALASIGQAYRHQLSDAGLLKELALEFIAIDKLQTAEDLLRRALGSPAVSNQANLSPTTPSTLLRKLLGDCLSGQNRAAEAVDEYQKIAGDDAATVEERMEALLRCEPLLATLGREEDARSVRQALQVLQQVQA